MSICIKSTDQKYILDYDELSGQLKVMSFSYSTWDQSQQEYNMVLSTTTYIGGGGTGSGGSGSSGSSGTSGTSGSSGFSGSSGTSGTSGAIGATGSTGPQGISTGQVYYFNQSATSSISPYRVLSPEPSPNGGSILTHTMLANELNYMFSSYITEQLGLCLG